MNLLKILFQMLFGKDDLPHTPQPVIENELKSCFHCGQMFKSKCKKYANDILHDCPHGLECNTLSPKCQECRDIRNNIYNILHGK